jgi:uncharacterized protein (TIGR00299 family) protein
MLLAAPLWPRYEAGMHAYFDAFSGISGDMTVGALLDLGLPLDELRSAIAGLGVEGCELVHGHREHGAIRAATFEVRTNATASERDFVTIRTILGRGSLAASVRDRALAAFRALAEAEAKVHAVTPDQVHFHEVGGTDTIADIVGAALGVEWLGITAIHVAPLPLGSGIVASRHGPLPVPAPATLELLRGFDVRPGDGGGEMVTPTGAAILRGFGAVSGPPPALRAIRIGYGSGTRELSDRPNVLRVILGEAAAPAERLADEMLVIEANIDDMNPELYAHASARLFGAGATDVTLIAAQMKKGRPGVLLQVLAPPELRDQVAAVLFAETTTIGARFHPVGRLKLTRRVEEVSTPYGPLAVKISGGPDGPRTVAPEYESCRRAAERHGVALRVVYEAALRAVG